MSNFDAIIKAARGSNESRPPETTESAESELEGQQLVRPLDKILNRETNTRELNQIHVEALAESIAVLGLLEPLVLDTRPVGSYFTTSLLKTGFWQGRIAWLRSSF